MPSTQIDFPTRARGWQKRFQKSVVWPLLSPFYLDYNQDYARTIFLAGTERSGTTWISDVINHQREYRYLFEPFWPHRVPLVKEFHTQQYLRPDDDSTLHFDVTNKILAGEVRDPWVDKYHRRVLVNQRLIKDVRANLMLKWMHEKFPDLPIVLLLRHPCAVVRSQLRRTYWQPDLAHEFLSQPELVEDFLAPFADTIRSAESNLDILVLRWCIQNYVPLKQFRDGEIYIAFYEDFCIDPATEIQKMFGYLEKPVHDSIYEKLNIPSPVTRTDSAIASGGNLINSWRKHITPEQLERTIEILSIFGLDQIYTDESMPHHAGLSKFLQTAGP